MDILIEAMWAVALVGLPIGLFTLAIVWWGMCSGHFLNANDSKELMRELKTMSGGNSEAESNKQGLIHRKWAKFGGGFYGVVAFFTYIIVEVTEIAAMIVNFGGLWDFIKQLDIGVIIGIFVEALVNFITAMVWPLYWMKQIDTQQTWIWFVVAYAGYLLGLRLAQQLNQRRSEA